MPILIDGKLKEKEKETVHKKENKTQFKHTILDFYLKMQRNQFLNKISMLQSKILLARVQAFAADIVFLHSAMEATVTATCCTYEGLIRPLVSCRHKLSASINCIAPRSSGMIFLALAVPHNSHPCTSRITLDPCHRYEMS